ncbi:MAG: hydantoinase/oxoprolinase family protein [Gammaproteobacteria bacterium]|nr:hydantoinase/oxoprolinase family protein [Gammaproteobacteria bacterium]
MSEPVRLAVDIGGTFTDLVLSTDDATYSTKLLTTPDAPERAVLEGTAWILAEADVPAERLTLVIHGTTLATNALIERKGARTALLATDGFTDAVEIAYEHRFEQYDLYMQRPRPLVPRHLRLPVSERIAADGSVLVPLDESALTGIARRLQAADIESLAICFLHSYINPEHEQRAARLLGERLPGLSISLSSTVCPEIREYERMSTTCANAYVQPLMAGYLTRLEQGLRELGSHAPLLLMMSSGAVTTVDTAVAQPIRLVESGPAGGVILARDIAAQLDLDRALSFDMGGTTAKLALIDDLRPQYSRSFEVAREYRFLRGSGLPIRVPVIDMVEIGAGGGSIARIDEVGLISVGPDSAGATPGPACYAQGGSEATVTDADLLLGRIDPQDFAAGRMTLDKQAANDALQPLGVALGGGPQLAAVGISEIVDETMASAARVHAVENGKDTTDRTLIATGGAAPLHAARLAQKLGIRRVVVPLGAGVGSAHGFLRAPIAYEVVRTRLMRLEAFEPRVLNELFAAMRSEAESVVRLAAPSATLDCQRQSFMRYRGQGHEIAVPLPDGGFDADSAALLRERFEQVYESIFGRVIPHLQIESVSYALSLSTAAPAGQPDRLDTGSAGTPVATERATRRVLVDPRTAQTIHANVLPRAELAPGSRIAGPAIIVEAQTATVVPAEFEARVSANRHLVLLQREPAASG